VHGTDPPLDDGEVEVTVDAAQMDVARHRLLVRSAARAEDELRRLVHRHLHLTARSRLDRVRRVGEHRAGVLDHDPWIEQATQHVLGLDRADAPAPLPVRLSRQRVGSSIALDPQSR
jgi:hypothetical protein